MSNTADLREILLTAEQISDFTGWNVRKIYYAASQDHLPIIKTGGNLIARKSELSEALSAKRNHPANA